MPDGLSGITDQLASLKEQMRGQGAMIDKIADKQQTQGEEQQKTNYRMDNMERRQDKSEGKIENLAHQQNKQGTKQDLLDQEMTSIKSDLAEINENTKYTRRQTANLTIGFITSLILLVAGAVINLLL